MNGRYTLNGRVVMLTGAAGLLGRVHARTLLEAGARLVLADTDRTGLEDLRDRLGNNGPEILLAEADVSKPEAVRQTVDEALRRFGRIDVLVNNAALNPRFDRDALSEHGVGFEDFPIDAWNAALAVNITGMFLCAQAVSRPMLKQGSGIVINISSMYGMVGPDQRLYQAPGQPARFKPVTYSVSKSAVYGFTKYLAAYWAGKNIRVNALTLGGVENNQDEGFIARYSARTPMGRMARPNEYGGALLFLASDASSYMTGANLVVDGGWTAW